MLKEKLRKREVRSNQKVLKAYKEFQNVAIFPVDLLDFEGMFLKAMDDKCNVEDMIRWYKQATEYLVDVKNLEDICRFMASHRIACVWVILLGKAHVRKKKIEAIRSGTNGKKKSQEEGS